MEVKENSGRLSRRHAALLAVVLSLGLGLRLYDLGEKSLWYDEGSTLTYAEAIESVGDAFDTTLMWDAPLYPVLVRGWEGLVRATLNPDRLSEQRDAAIRLLPLIFGVLAMALVFVTARLILQNDAAAIAAAFLYAISPYQIRHAQELRNYTLYTSLGLAALYFWVRAMRDNRRRHWVGIAVTEAVLLYTHFFSAWFIATVNLYAVIVFVAGRRRDDRIKPWLLSQVFAAALSLPALLILRQVLSHTADIKYHWYQLLGLKFALITFKSFFAGFSPNVAVYWTIFLAAGALFCLGLYALRRRWQPALLLALLVAAPLGGTIALAHITQHPLYEMRLFILSGAAACIVVGAGICALPRPWLQGAAVAALGALTIPMLVDYYEGRLHPVEAHRVGMWDKVDLRAAARYVAEHAKPGDVVGHPGHFSRPPFLNYLEGAPVELPQPVLGHSQLDRDLMVGGMGSLDLSVRHGLLPEPVQDVADHAQRIWFVDAGGTNFNWPPTVMLLREWLETNTVREDYQEFNRVSLTCYRTEGARNTERLREKIRDVGAGWSVESRQQDEFMYVITLRNDTDTMKTLHCTVYESAGAIEPLAWRRETPLKSPWRPESLYDPESGGTFNLPGMTATLSKQTLAAEMQGWAVLPPGRYVPFLRVLEQPEQGTSRAAGILMDADRQSIGALDGTSQEGDFGWHWRPLNEFETPGGVTRFTMRAENTRNLDTAWFQMGKILFIEAANSRVAGAPVKKQFDVELGPRPGNTDTCIAIDPSLRQRTRVDIEVFEPETRTCATLTFYVERK